MTIESPNTTGQRCALCSGYFIGGHICFGYDPRIVQEAPPPLISENGLLRQILDELRALRAALEAKQ